MRQIGTLPDAQDARAIAGYLAGLSIEARLVQSPGGWELWRVVTPAFIHFSEFHILFNMLWLFSLGGQLELRYGSARLVVLVLLMAVPSNLCQYFFSTIVIEGWKPVVTQSSPLFGGMSGVVFGLFGF